MEFPELDIHCAEKSCQETNFLVYKCDGCKASFCFKHKDQDAHNCQNKENLAKYPPIFCPICGKSVGYGPGDDPNKEMAKHIDNNCAENEFERKRKLEKMKNRCYYCNKNDLSYSTCKKCNKNFCLSHRLERDHECGTGKRKANPNSVNNNSNNNNNNNSNTTANNCTLFVQTEEMGTNKTEDELLDYSNVTEEDDFLSDEGPSNSPIPPDHSVKEEKTHVLEDTSGISDPDVLQTGSSIDITSSDISIASDISDSYVEEANDVEDADEPKFNSASFIGRTRSFVYRIMTSQQSSAKLATEEAVKNSPTDSDLDVGKPDLESFEEGEDMEVETEQEEIAESFRDVLSLYFRGNSNTRLNELYSIVEIGAPILPEALSIINLSIPIALSYLLGIFSSMVNISFVGHFLGETEMGATALAIMLFNVSAYSIGIGVLTSLDTLGSQAFGAKNYIRIGIILQRSLIILGLIVIPIYIFWIFSDQFFILVGQGELTAKYASRYLKILAIALPFAFFAEALKRYLQAQRIVIPGTIAQFFVLIFNILCNSFFFLYLEMGLDGSAAVLVITNMVNAAVILGITLFGNLHYKSWGGFTFEAFHGLGEYMKLALPGIVMVCADWWGFEIQSLIAGNLGTTALDANTVLFNSMVLLYMCPLSVGLSSGTKIGNYLGSNEPKHAKRITRVGLVLSLMITTCQGGALVLCRNFWGYLFSSSKDVVQLAAHIIPLTAIFAVADGMMAVSASIFRACGRQLAGGIINCLCHFIVGIPSAYVVAIQLGHGLIGQWVCLSVAGTSAAILYTSVILFSNWEKLAESISQREKNMAPKTVQQH